MGEGLSPGAEASSAEALKAIASTSSSWRLIIDATERVVGGTAHLQNDAAARLDAIQARLADEAGVAEDGEAAAWLAAQADGLARGCPAAQIVAYVGARRAVVERQAGRAAGVSEHSLRRQALGMELAANTVLSTRADFVEGASCAIGGLRCGDPPLWRHRDRAHAANDPEVTRLVAAVLASKPLDLDHRVWRSGF